MVPSTNDSGARNPDEQSLCRKISFAHELNWLWNHWYQQVGRPIAYLSGAIMQAMLLFTILGILEMVTATLVWRNIQSPQRLAATIRLHTAIRTTSYAYAYAFTYINRDRKIVVLIDSVWSISVFFRHSSACTATIIATRAF